MSALRYSSQLRTSIVGFVLRMHILKPQRPAGRVCRARGEDFAAVLGNEQGVLKLRRSLPVLRTENKQIE